MKYYEILKRIRYKTKSTMDFSHKKVMKLWVTISCIPSYNSLFLTENLLNEMTRFSRVSSALLYTPTRGLDKCWYLHKMVQGNSRGDSVLIINLSWHLSKTDLVWSGQLYIRQTGIFASIVSTLLQSFSEVSHSWKYLTYFKAGFRRFLFKWRQSDMLIELIRFFYCIKVND